MQGRKGGNDGRGSQDWRNTDGGGRGLEDRSVYWREFRKLVSWESRWRVWSRVLKSASERGVLDAASMLYGTKYEISGAIRKGL